MLYYLIPLIVIFFAALKYDLNESKGQGKYFVWGLLYVYLTVLMGLRFEVGGDTINYMNFWKSQEDISHWEFTFKGYFAPGYSLLTALSYTISPGFYVFQFLHAVILNTLLFIFISQSTEYKFTAFLFVFFLIYLYFATEILRESIAVIIFLLNIKNLEKHKWLRYYLGAFISILFHFSAIILFFIPLISKIKFNKFYFFYVAVVLTLSITMSKILYVLTNVSIISEGVSKYVEDGSHGLLADTMRTLRTFIFPAFVVYFAKYCMHISVKYENYIAIYTLLGLASLFSPIIFSRFTNYFIVLYAISFGEIIIKSIKNKKSVAFRHNAIVLLLCFIFLYGSEYVLYKRYTRWIPYYSIFNPHHVNRDNYNNIN